MHKGTAFHMGIFKSAGEAAKRPPLNSSTGIMEIIKITASAETFPPKTAVSHCTRESVIIRPQSFHFSPFYARFTALHAPVYPVQAGMDVIFFFHLLSFPVFSILYVPQKRLYDSMCKKGHSGCGCWAFTILPFL